MDDKTKLALIAKLAANALEYHNDNSEALYAVMDDIAQILDFGEDDAE